MNQNPFSPIGLEPRKRRPPTSFERLKGWCFDHLIAILVLGLLAIFGIVWLAESGERDRYRKDCLDAGGKMIGETCYLPNHQPVNGAEEDTTAIITQ